jgi:ABC-type multidrug transport system ATPase subunit
MATDTAPAATAAAPGTATRAAPAIAIDRLTRRFGERDALAEVSVMLERGQTLLVLGPNGAGKTTLLRVLATLLLPHEGTVSVLGFELPRQGHLLRRYVGMLGHEPLLYRDLSGRENLAFYARLYGVPEPEARIAELLAATEMTTRADEPVRNLSRGMAQRLAVCRATLHRPQVLLLDEPQAHLDPHAAALAEPLIGRTSGITRVLVSHDVERALSEADCVLALRDGRAMIEAPVGQVTATQLRALYEAR